ncbi:MAG TPA: hypothetical protein VK988_20205 [Acidimicrobiales bacterium]|nr:hypothetical protein [Acidimicrobiales bacterium]
MEEGAEAVLREQLVEERLVPDVTPNVPEAGVTGGVRVEVDAHEIEPLLEKPLLEDPPEEACPPPGDPDRLQVWRGTRNTPSFAVHSPR